MEEVAKRWSQYPITPVKSLALSTSGLLALADLSTIAKRTAITGTSTWLDVLLLAPGLHTQQAAEALGQPHPARPLPEVTNLNTGALSSVTNTATIHYLQRIDKSSKTTIIDVGIAYTHDHRRLHGSRKRIFPAGTPPSSKISTILYLLGPCLTITAIILDCLIKDWWSLGLLLSLMFARALNVWIIQERTRDQPKSSGPNDHQCWWVLVDETHRVCLRGLRYDLEAITTGEWMRARKEAEGYMEAFAKMIVYLVAVFSGNQTQSGSIILMVLLGLSAGLLAMSNSFATSFNMNGRTAVVTPQTGPAVDPKRNSDSPSMDPPGYTGSASSFEKQEAAVVLETTYPFSNEVNYV